MTRSYRKDSFSRPLEQYASPSRVPSPIRELPAGQTYQLLTQPLRSSPLNEAKPRVTNKGTSLIIPSEAKTRQSRRNTTLTGTQRSKTTSTSRQCSTHRLSARRKREQVTETTHSSSQARQNLDEIEKMPRLPALSGVKTRADHENTLLTAS